MVSRFSRSFESPDDVIEDSGVREEVVQLAGTTVGRYVIQPGWRWSVDVRPHMGTEWCRARHVGFSVRGRLRVSLDDGTEFDIEPGHVFLIPPGHDIWVAGDEPAETIEWAGALSWHPGPESTGQRALVTLVLSDIAGSTATAQRLGDQRWRPLLRAHDETSSDVVNRFGGTVIKGTGDGILAIFPSAERAVRAAMALRDETQPLGIRIRVGVHTGEVDLVADDVHGVAVHAVARIASLAAPDEVLVSATTVGLVTGSGTEFVPRGEHELRGVEGRHHLFEALPGVP
jgi:class 3 adenylate cyclase